MSEPSVPSRSFSPSQKPALLNTNGLPLWRNILNAVSFQLGWFACILGGDIPAVIALGALLVCHYFLIRPEGDSGEWPLVAVVGLVGLGCDSLLSLAGVLVFDSPSAGLIPLWLLVIWLLFATTLRHSLGWLEPRPVLAALLGAVVGPCSYFAGAQLAGVSLLQPQWLALSVLALVWAVMLPLLFRLSRWFRLCHE